MGGSCQQSVQNGRLHQCLLIQPCQYPIIYTLLAPYYNAQNLHIHVLLMLHVTFIVCTHQCMCSILLFFISLSCFSFSALIRCSSSSKSSRTCFDLSECSNSTITQHFFRNLLNAIIGFYMYICCGEESIVLFHVCAWAVTENAFSLCDNIYLY